MVDAAFFMNLVNTYGYLGVFLVSLIGSLSLFVPLPSFVIVVAAGSVLNPFLVGLAAGLGAALGELLGYGIGIGLLYGKKKIIKKKAKLSKNSKNERKWTKVLKKWFSMKFGMLVVFIFAVTPLPDKIIGIFCGIIKYDLKKFLIAMSAGKIVLHLALAYAGFYGIGFIESFL